MEKEIRDMNVKELKALAKERGIKKDITGYEKHNL